MKGACFTGTCLSEVGSRPENGLLTVHGTGRPPEFWRLEATSKPMTNKDDDYVSYRVVVSFLKIAAASDIDWQRSSLEAIVRS